MHVVAPFRPFRAGANLNRGCWSRLCLFAAMVLSASAAWAGGGPENVLLVVNPRSADSVCIANHYASLRAIPANNIVYMPWDPKSVTTDAETFRRQILRPVLDVTRGRGGRQIDYVIYSSDFPWGIDLSADVAKFTADLKKRQDASDGKDTGAWPKYFTARGSINGLTYLWEPFMAGYAGYFDMHSNWYSQPREATRAFTTAKSYGKRGEEVDAGGRRYLLSAMLGLIAKRGNTREEVIAYLSRSAAADGTQPRGTIYFAQNSDIRSRVRQGEFPSVVRQLKAMGVAAEIVEGTMPLDKDDVQGVMMGTPRFDWKSSHSTIRPGAICEHFTSYGGDMNPSEPQTPLSEFLRYGAAGSSGTVIEPFAIPNKFPDAAMQVHYARGCTLTEAFYQSILCPYQLLIVGDPLCRPWANIPEVTVSGVEAGATVTGPLHIEPKAQFAGDAVAQRFDFFVDGLRVLECRPGDSLDLDTAKLADGYHELRIVAIESSPIRSQGRRIVPITTANHHRTIEVTASPTETLDLRQTLVITAKAAGCSQIAVLQGTRVVGRIAAEEGRVEIDGATIGAGPVRLQVVGLGKEGPNSNVLAKPLQFVVKNPS